MPSAHLLSQDEFGIVQDTFGNVERRMKIDGHKMFTKLFEVHPSYKKMFPDFETLSDAELKHSPRMKAHVMRVMTALRLLTDSMVDERAIDRTSESIAKWHDARGMRKTQFQHFKPIFLDYVGECITTSVAREAWSKAFDCLTYYMSFD